MRVSYWKRCSSIKWPENTAVHILSQSKLIKTMSFYRIVFFLLCYLSVFSCCGGGWVASYAPWRNMMEKLWKLVLLTPPSNCPCRLALLFSKGTFQFPLQTAIASTYVVNSLILDSSLSVRRTLLFVLVNFGIKHFHQKLPLHFRE